MTLTTTANRINVMCDKCKRFATASEPVFEFYTTTRTRERNIIDLHEACMVKEIQRAKRNLKIREGKQ